MTSTGVGLMRALKLFLIRHAIAEERGPSWPDDDLRPLSEVGVRRFETIAEGLMRVDAMPEQILTSPLVRAASTAAILSRAVRPRITAEEMAVLAPGHAPEQVVEQLERQATCTRVALVGHEPDIGMLAAHLLGAPHPVPFKKGAVCRIELPDGTVPGRLVWLLPPAVLRSLGRGR